MDNHKTNRNEMILKNTIVTFTVILPELEVDPNLGIAVARDKIRCRAEHLVSDKMSEGVDSSIKDCPDYPALCD